MSEILDPTISLTYWGESGVVHFVSGGRSICVKIPPVDAHALYNALQDSYRRGYRTGIASAARAVKELENIT